MKTKIVTTKKKNSKMSRKIGKHITKKVRRKHSGYSMKRILKGQMTYKSRKR